MQTMSKEKALELLRRAILSTPTHSEYIPGLVEWVRNARVLTEMIFGKRSEQSQEMNAGVERVLELPPKSATQVDRCLSMSGLLQSFQFEVSEFWSDEGVEEPIEYAGDMVEIEEGLVDTQSKDVFIVHGHDHGRMEAVARFLEHIDLNPVILHERASAGATLIEKLETHAEVAFAVVLLTPDDVGSIASDEQNLQPRARQNVVLELGYFLGRLGRRKTGALLVEGVEIPSDYSGVVYIRLDEESAWKFQLAKELRAAGLPVDFNKLD